MSTTINSIKATTTAAIPTIKSPENCVSPTKTTLVVVAAPSPSSSSTTTTAAAVAFNAAENNSNTISTTIISASSPCNSCSSSLTSWSDVLCANAYCSSTKQQPQQQKQQNIYKNKEEEEEQTQENASLTTTSNNTLIIPQLATCQQNNFTKYEQQDANAFDSGRESVNECDSSLDESINYPSCSATNFPLQQRSKKPCTLDFYASSGSQTKWYLPPSRDIVKINVPPASTECLMTKSCVSIAEPESSVVTPPSDHGEEVSGGEQDHDMATNDKM